MHVCSCFSDKPIITEESPGGCLFIFYWTGGSGYMKDSEVISPKKEDKFSPGDPDFMMN